MKTQVVDSVNAARWTIPEVVRVRVVTEFKHLSLSYNFLDYIFQGLHNSSFLVGFLSSPGEWNRNGSYAVSITRCGLLLGYLSSM